MGATPASPNPYAAYGGAIATPTTQAAAPPVDPYAAYGGTSAPGGTPINQKAAPTPADVSNNPNGEGVYGMTDAAGKTVKVPYSKVPYAQHSMGYQLTGPEAGRFDKDLRNDPEFLKQAGEMMKDLAPGGAVTSGMVKSAGQILPSVAGGIDWLAAKAAHLTGTKTETPWKPAVEAAENRVLPGITQPLSGVGEHIGATAELAGEFAYGEGEWRALTKGLSIAEKLKMAQPAIKFLAEHPNAARAAQVGAGALDSAASGGVVGTTQALAHGATPAEALESGGITAATAGLVHGVTGGVGAMATANAERTAATEAATAAHEAAPGVLKDRAATMTAERQAAAQQMVKNTAKTATQGVIDRINEARQPPLAITGLPTAEANFPQIDAQAAVNRTNTFGDAADEARSAAKEIYDKLDQATGGKFNELKNARNTAYNAGNMEKYQAASEGIESLLDKNPGVSPEEFASAKSAWKDERDLDRIHNAVEGSFNNISENMAAQPGTSPRLIKGGTSAAGALQTNLGKLLKGKNAIPEERLGQLMGQDGLANLYRASHLVSTPELRTATQSLAEQVAAEFPKPTDPKAPAWVKTIGRYSIAGLGAQAVSHMSGLPSAYVTPAAEGTAFVLHQMVTNPRVGQLMDYAVRNGVTPKLAAGLIANTISAGMNENRNENPQPQENK